MNENDAIRLIVDQTSGKILRWYLIQKENVSRIRVPLGHALVEADRLPNAAETHVDLNSVGGGRVPLFIKRNPN